MAIDKMTIVQCYIKNKQEYSATLRPPRPQLKDIKIVFLKAFPNAIALIFGITIKRLGELQLDEQIQLQLNWQELR
jgi:hypothetical protein